MDIKKTVENVLEETLRHLRAIVDVECIVGQPIVKEGATIIPISKVSIGFVSGGGEYGNVKKIKKELSYPFAGGSGGGCNLSPIGFLVVLKDKVEYVKVAEENTLEKILDIANAFLKNVK